MLGNEYLVSMSVLHPHTTKYKKFNYHCGIVQASSLLSGSTMSYGMITKWGSNPHSFVKK